MDQILGGPRGPLSDAVDRICQTLGAPAGGLPSATQVIGAQQAAEAAVAAATATTIAADVPAAAPAGGTGAAAGGWDTAANRDLAITTINDLRTHAIEMDLDYEAMLVDVAALRVTVNSLLVKLREHGLIAP